MVKDKVKVTCSSCRYAHYKTEKHMGIGVLACRKIKSVEGKSNIYLGRFTDQEFSCPVGKPHVKHQERSCTTVKQ